MQKIGVNTASRPSSVFCGGGAAEEAARFLAGKDVFLLTDNNVYSLYKELIEEKFGGARVFAVPAGERHKNRHTLFQILDGMLEAKLNRNSWLAALGGGVIGDMGGLAAALYMRGIRAVQIPTTLLAQVDSSVGGKTAIDYRGVKNVIGAFYQPEYVFCDPLFLHTLPRRELRCGLGEIVKTCALDQAILEKTEAMAGRLFGLAFQEEITADCVRFKARIVEEDECERSGRRKCLNMGHTTGHALELSYGRRSHGEYVLIGMAFEIAIALEEGILSAEYAARLRALIGKVIGKTPRFAGIEEAALAALYDKKNSGRGEVSLIVPEAPGRYRELVLPIEKYVRYLSRFNGGIA